MNRRGFLGILAAAAAPAIIRTPGLLMSVKAIRPVVDVPRALSLLEDYAQVDAALAEQHLLANGPLRVGDVFTVGPRISAAWGIAPGSVWQVSWTTAEQFEDA